MANFQVLGLLAVTVDGHPISIRSRRQRAVLAMLLTNAGRTTSLDRLLRALWADEPPDTAVGQIQTVVWRLRGLVGEATIVTDPGGYRLVAAVPELDSEQFAATAARAAELVGIGDLSGAAEQYAEALRLWRGRPFADVQLPGDAHGSGFQSALATLAEQRIAVERGYFDVELALGRHADLIPLLYHRVEEEPLREELRERLMLALDRCGRRAEALEVYQRGRAAIVAELGLEPGPGLQRVHRLILTGGPTTDLSLHLAAAEVRRPAQLPMDAANFIARTELADKLAALLCDPGVTTPSVIAVSGAAGCGKTTLAVHVAHLVRERFPDGQLFADLRGVDDPLDPAEVLARFLRALGEDARGIPVEFDERAALFRARLAGQRVLVLLDNAAGESQLRLLMPAEPGCAVLVTSRRRLAAQLGAHEVDLGIFEPEEALDLLRTALTPDRVAAQRDACLLLAQRCGYLPLAIRIAAARLAMRPHWPVAHLAEQLADERGRLDVLSTVDLAVRSSLALGVGALDPPDRQLFGLLGTVEADHLPGWVAAPLLDLSVAAAEEPVERLAEARLVEAEPGQGGWSRYRLHDLVRALAREGLADSGDAGLRRLFGAWLTLADAAYERMPGGFRRVATISAPRWSSWSPSDLDSLLADAVAWCESERSALVAAVRQAASMGQAEAAWNLAVTLSRFFELREHLDDWRITHEAALRACIDAGDRAGEAYLLRGLGELHLSQDRFVDALTRLEPALSLMEALDDRPGQAAVLRAQGTGYRMLGRPVDAMAALGRARAIFAETGDQTGEAQTLHNIGAVHRLSDRPAAARDAYAQALEIFDETGDRFGQAFTLCSLGLVAGREPGQVSEADRQLRQSLELCRELGYRRGEAIALGNLGNLHRKAGRSAIAVKELTEAVSICREIGDVRGEVIELRRLGETYLDLDRVVGARSVLQRSLSLARELGLVDDQQETLRLLGRVQPPADA